MQAGINLLNTASMLPEEAAKAFIEGVRKTVGENRDLGGSLRDINLSLKHDSQRREG
jgi:hypothetical protein